MTEATLGSILLRHTTARGDKVALRFQDSSCSYSELERRACQVANGLKAGGVRAGDRVAWLGKNSLSYFEYLVGAAKAGAVVVPINWRLAPPEIEFLLEDCRPALDRRRTGIRCRIAEGDQRPPDAAGRRRSG